MAKLQQVDYDPFAPSEGSMNLVPVDHDPFAKSADSASVNPENSWSDELKNIGKTFGNASSSDWGTALNAGAKTLASGIVSGGQGLLPAFDEVGAGIRGGAAGVKALVTGNPVYDAYSNEYDQSLNNIRGNIAEYDKQNPVASTVGKVSGGLISAPLFAGAKGLSVLQQMYSGAKTAGGLGLATGFTGGEGFGNRLKDSVLDGVGYGMFGAAVPAVLGGGSYLVGKGVDAGKWAGKSAASLLQDWFAPEISAAKKIGTALMQDSPEILPQEVIQAARDRGLSLAEVGGKNIQGIADRFAQSPGEARPMMAQMMQERVAQQAEGIPNLIKDTLGAEGAGTNAIDMANQRKLVISPLAEKAFLPANDVASAVGSDPQIQQLLKNTDVQSGLPLGLRIIKNEADATGKQFVHEDYGITGFTPEEHSIDPFTKLKTVTKGSEPVFSGVPNMRMLDAAKRGLDAQINANTNEFGQVNQLGRTLVMLKQALVGRMKALNPQYAEYLNTAADQFSLENAAKLGRGIWNTANKEETISRLSDLSAPEKKMALEGAVRGLVESIERKGDSANHAVTNLGKKYYRDLLAPLVDNPQQLDELVTTLQAQAEAFARNRGWLGGAQTALRLGGEKISSLGDIGKAITGKMLNSDKVNAAQARMILNRNPQELQQYYDDAMRLSSGYKAPPSMFAQPQVKQLPNYQNPLALFYAGSSSDRK